MNKNRRNNIVTSVSLGLSAVGVFVLIGLVDNIAVKVENQKNMQFISNEMPEIEETLNLKLQGNENLRKIAFFIQKSEIQKDGSIKNPKYFMSLPLEYRYAIIRVKDYETYLDLFDYCLHTKISDDEKVRFEKELLLQDVQIDKKTR